METLAKLRNGWRPFILAKVNDEDGEKEWQNLGYDLFKEQVGEKTHQYMLTQEFKDALDSSKGLMGGLGLKLKKTRLGLMLQNGGIPHPYTEGTSPRSIGGAGFATVINNTKFPANDFFVPGRVFRLRMRHSNLCYGDDSMMDGRVACIKLADQEEGGPLDLILHTGRMPPYYNAATYEEFLQASKRGEEAMKMWTLTRPSNYFARVDGLRLMPESYHDQRYYSHAIYQFEDTSGKQWVVRFKLIPTEGTEESGLLGEKDQRATWVCKGSENVNELKGYLRKQYAERLQRGPIQYRLQMQWKEQGELSESSEVLNPCRVWPADLHPWADVAMLTVALPLSEDILAGTTYSLETHPACLRLPPAEHVHQFASLGHVMADLQGNLEKGLVTADRELEEAFQNDYTVSVVTGNVGNAGTDADVYITLTGTKGRSKPIGLDTSFHDDFEAGQTDVFKVKAPFLGDIVTVQMSVQSLISRVWFLDYVTVTDEQTGTEARFPCYQWLSTNSTTNSNTVLLRREEAVLSHEEFSMYCYLQRKYEMHEKQRAYRWEKIRGLPSRFLKQPNTSLPREERFHQEKEQDLREKYYRTLTNSGLGTIKTLLEGFDSLLDYKKLLTKLLKDKKTVHQVAQRWDQDVEFGRQVLNGVHPNRIRRVRDIPANMSLCHEMFEGVLDRGLTLRQECKEGHVYMLSYPELESTEKIINSNTKTKRYLSAPVCLLYVDQSSQLRPIAIQLHQKPGPTNPVWLPKDDEHSWMFAKMWVRVADAQVHQIVSRHLYCHLVMEVVAVATMRGLPSVHPVFKLLIPHLRYTIAVNVMGRQSLYPAEDGLFEKYLAVGSHYEVLMKEAYKHFKLSHLNLPKNLKDRGVDDPNKLPGYYYRDDGLELWRIIKKFVRTLLMLHYWTAENVRNDSEVQNWMYDMHANGFPACPGGGDNEVPSEFNNLDELIEFITMVIFTASCQNAALTAGMVDYYGFVPNMPSLMMQPPPMQKDAVSLKDILRSLPSRTKTAEIISAVYTLSRFSKDELYLGQYPNCHFGVDTAQAAILAFQEDLRTVSEAIRERNEKLDMPYKYLIPERVPNSIST